MSIALSITVGVLVVFLITVLTGYFVAQEFAFLAVDRTRLQARAAGDGASMDAATDDDGELLSTRSTLALVLLPQNR